MTTHAKHRHWDLTEAVIGALIEVHRQLGPGLLESVYELCLAEELRYRGLRFARQVPITVFYRDVVVRSAYQADLIVEERLLIELKAVESFAPIHLAQTLTYLKLLRLELGLLVNFNCVALKDGLRRLTRNEHGASREADEPSHSAREGEFAHSARGGEFAHSAHPARGGEYEAERDFHRETGRQGG